MNESPAPREKPGSLPNPWHKSYALTMLGVAVIGLMLIALSRFTVIDLLSMTRPMLEIGRSTSPSGRWTVVVMQGDPLVYAERRIEIQVLKNGSSRPVTAKALELRTGGGSLKNGKHLISWATAQTREIATVELLTIHGEQVSHQVDPEAIAGGL